MIDYEVFIANPRVEKRAEPIESPVPLDFSSFELQYAWFCLTSHGFRVTDQITPDFVQFLQDEVMCRPDADILKIINAVTAEVENASICNLKESFEKELETASTCELRSDETQKESEENQNLAKVRRLILTPTTVKGLPEDLILGNRIIREFGADRFIRVTIRDEDFQLLSNTYGRLRKPLQEIKTFLLEGLRVGNRHYKFLGCSRRWLLSKLRECGLWMYASDGSHTVESIRDWMGDLSQEFCVATYLARIGLCFTPTMFSVEVKNVEIIQDIVEGGFLFTEGIGKISRSLAESVRGTNNFCSQLRLAASTSQSSIFIIHRLDHTPNNISMDIIVISISKVENGRV